MVVVPPPATPAPLLLCGFQVEFDALLHEPDVAGDGRGPTDAKVVLPGDDDALDALSRLQQGVLDVAYVPLDLADDGVAGPPPLQFGDQEPGFVSLLMARMSMGPVSVGYC